MEAFILTFGRILIWLIVGVLAAHSVIRIIRYFFKFPIPSFLVRLIDNPLRRKIQVPQELIDHLNIDEGLHLLEIGPGSGTYTQAFSHAVGKDGFITAVDIEMSVLTNLKKRMNDLGVPNICPLVADVHHLPFRLEAYDAVYMITVIGEIPSPKQALESFFEVLKPGGKLMFSELLLDPDFPLPRTLRAWASSARCHEQQGNLLTYTITFTRP